MKVTGIAVGKHKSYRHMCVLDYGGSFTCGNKKYPLNKE